MATDPRVILQPAGGSDAKAHYLKTIHAPLRLAPIAHILDEKTSQRLTSEFPTGWLRVWGVTRGENGVNRNKWNRFAPGDRVLFCGQSKVYASTSLRHKVHNHALALCLWGTDAKGQAREYAYFVGDVRDQNIRVSDLATIVGFKPGLPSKE